MRKRDLIDENVTLKLQIQAHVSRIQEWSKLSKQMSVRIADLEDELKRRPQPKFLLAKFTGYNSETKRRELFDVYALPVDEGYGFPLAKGYTSIEVDVRAVK